MLNLSNHHDGLVQDCSISIANTLEILQSYSKSNLIQPPEGLLSIKMSSYQYKDPHVKDKMVSWPSYLWHGNLIPGKDGLYIETGPRFYLNPGWPECVITMLWRGGVTHWGLYRMFSIQHFQMHFHEWKWLHCDSNFTEICLWQVR